MMHFDMKDIDKICELIKEEFCRATTMFGKFNTAHEGYAILLEEVDELWENVKLNQFKHKDRNIKIRKEAIHVATMAIRLIHDCCKEEKE